jgi:putative transcriptional regulator
MLQTDNNSLANQYLLATPSIQDPLFASSIVYMCEHTIDGSMGLVINHLSDQTLEDIFDQLEIECEDQNILNTHIFIGGPVKLQQGFVLHTPQGNWDKTMLVGEDIFLTSSRDILEAIAHHQGPEQYLVLLGFSGWAPGQLEKELQENSWLTAKATHQITYSHDIDQKWQMAFDTLGFNLDKLSPTTGNA